MTDNMNAIIQENMVSMISDIDINSVKYDIRMSMIDSLARLIIDITGDRTPSKDVYEFLSPVKGFDIMNIKSDIKTGRAENVILIEILHLMEQLDPAQRTVVMHYLKTLWACDGDSLLRDRNSFQKRYKPVARALKKFKGDSPFVCRKCKKVHDMEKECDIIFDLDRPKRFPDCDEALAYSFMFTFKPVNQWACVECFNPHEGI